MFGSGRIFINMYPVGLYLLPLFWHITIFSPLIRQLLFISFIASTGTGRGKMKYKCHMLHLELPINIYNIEKMGENLKFSEHNIRHSGW